MVKATQLHLELLAAKAASDIEFRKLLIEKPRDAAAKLDWAPMLDDDAIAQLAKINDDLRRLSDGVLEGPPADRWGSDVLRYHRGCIVE